MSKFCNKSEEDRDTAYNNHFDSWVDQLGFGIKSVSGVKLLIDDCGNEREATLNERVLWDQLIASTSMFSES